MVVTLEITYPNDDHVTVLKTVTGDDPLTVDVEKGWFSFGNLLLDEDYDGAGGNEPTYSMKILQSDNDSTNGGVLIYGSGNTFVEPSGGWQHRSE